MTGVVVDLEQLGDLVDRMTACAQRFEAVSDDVDARMRRVHAVWRGKAAAEQGEAHRRWLAGAAEMHNALTVLRSIASTAEGNYAAAMRANAQMWCR